MNSSLVSSLKNTTLVTQFNKKGLGSFSRAISAKELKQLNLGWYYNWTPFPKEDSVSSLEFVPMFWGRQDVTGRNLDLVQQSNATHVLGFNEPDLEGQANMTVAECLDLWTHLMPLKQRLGSPAPASPSWLEKFMPEAERRGLRIDFVCIHIYPDISDPQAVEHVERKLREVYQRYKRPVWLTECGAADIKAWNQPQLGKPTPEAAQDFLQKLLVLLEQLPFVERYAWFADRVGEEYSLGSIFQMQANALTLIGELYRDAA